MNIDVGQVIAGKYELVRLLGKGAMGEVWLATHNSLGGEFAIKLVEPADDQEAETAAGRFQLEAQIAAKLSRRTRHIVSVSDHGEENGLAYLVMELLEGESLEHRTKRAGTLDLPEVAAIVGQVARALSLAHDEGIFHRDLKPANVWLGRDEDGRLLVKLLDFGIARSAKPFRTRSPFMTSKDMVLGTPSYMSPEQARGLDTLDYRCDLWALAVVAYEALTGRIPFEGETVEDIFLSICTFRVVPIAHRRTGLPPALADFFGRAFAPKVEDRFASAIELNEAFEAFVSPDELATALGIRPGMLSSRRLEMRTGAASSPDLQAAAVVTPAEPPAATGTPPSRRDTSTIGFEETGRGLDSMSISRPPMKRGGGLLVALAILLLLGLGAGVFVITRPKAIATPTPPTPSSVVAAATPPPPPETTPPPPPPAVPASTPAHTTAKPAGRPPKPAAASVSIAPAPPPVVVPPAPQPAPPPPPKPSPTPARSVDRGGVF